MDDVQKEFYIANFRYDAKTVVAVVKFAKRLLQRIPVVIFELTTAQQTLDFMCCTMSRLC
jgi:hypothetical protein